MHWPLWVSHISRVIQYLSSHRMRCLGIIHVLQCTWIYLTVKAETGYVYVPFCLLFHLSMDTCGFHLLVRIYNAIFYPPPFSLSNTVFYFWDRASLDNPSRHWIHCIDDIGLKLVTILLPQTFVYGIIGMSHYIWMDKVTFNEEGKL